MEMEAFIDDKMSKEIGFYSIAINAEKLIRAEEDIFFSNIVETSIFPVPDGVAGILLLKKKGIHARKMNLPRFIVEYCEKKKLKIGLVGATSESNLIACNNLKKKYPRLNLVLNLNGYSKEEKIVAELNKSNPDVILLGMGSPKQEILSKKLNKLFPKLIIINCGGAIDIFSGKVKRAPSFIQNLQIEWLYRMIVQPKRIKRYIHLIKFIKIYMKS